VSEPLKPDFTTILVEDVNLPYRKKAYKKLSYTDPILDSYQAIVIADTVAQGCSEDSRLTSLILRFPRVILPEFNTHRVFSRNSASSRARSIRVTIEDVMTNPYIPLFTVNQKGMSGEYVTSEGREAAISNWLEARDSAVVHTLSLLLGELFDKKYADHKTIASEWEKWVDLYYDKVYDNTGELKEGTSSIHKQNVNRILEPYMWHEVLVTSNFWKNFLELRTEGSAQPEIQAISFLVKKALEVSEASVSWIHLPFIDDELIPSSTASFEELKDLLMLSATECAQISYKDKSKAEKSTATTALGYRLLKMKHLSPFEHIAISLKNYDVKTNFLNVPDGVSGNFNSDWGQLRRLLNFEDVPR